VKCALLSGTVSSTKLPLPVPWQTSALGTSATAVVAVASANAPTAAVMSCFM
jgi:hypothetical protein